MDTTLNQKFFRGNKSLFDWDSAVSALLQRVNFDQTLDFFNTSRFKSIKALETELDALDYTLSQYDNILSSVQTSFTYLGSECHLEQIVSSILKDQSLLPKQVNQIALMTETIFELIKFHKPIFNDHYLQFARDKKGRVLSKILKPIREILDQNGEVNYFKHPLFRELSEEIRLIEQSARGQIDKIVEKHSSNNHLAFNSFDIIHDHYVIPIKTDYYNSAHGQIIARSSTGNTFYIEPFELAEKSRKRQELIVKRDELLYKFLKEIQEELLTEIDFLKASYPKIYHIDLLLAKAYAAMAFNLTRPKVATSFLLELKDLVHPLIENCQSNSVSLSFQDHGMLISGPNTGGKSVLLKSTALAIELFNKGFFLPCTHAELPLNTKLFYYSSDMQDLKEGLSSFSSEATEYLKLFDSIDSPTFLFFDEIFNSTTSDEASALAYTIFEKLTELFPVKIFASTHHHYLKVKIAKNSHFLSAHTEFDSEKGIPTYRLRVGEPGSSMAIETFERIQKELDIEIGITTDAKKLINSKQLLYEGLLSDLAKKQGELTVELSKYKNLNHELENQKKAAQGILDLKMSKELQQFQEDMVKLRKQFNSVVDEAKKSNKQTINDQIKKFQDLEKKLPKEKKKESSTDNTSKPNSFAIGNYYFIKQLQIHVELLSFNEKRNSATVLANGKKINVKLSDLYTSSKRKAKQKSIVLGGHHVTRETSLEFDARGLLLDDFIQQVELKLSDLHSGEQPFLNIIHGHGNGVLKKWLRDYLKNNNDFTWESDEANDGHTRVKIR